MPTFSICRFVSEGTKVEQISTNIPNSSLLTLQTNLQHGKISLFLYENSCYIGCILYYNNQPMISSTAFMRFIELITFELYNYK